MRFGVVDGIRGHLLIGMLIAHLGFKDGLGFLLQFHHFRVLRLYDAEFFVTISGAMVGYLIWAKLGTAERFWRFMRSRLATIYKYYLISALPFLLTVILLAIREPGTGLSAIPLAALDILLLQSGGAYSDILPIYFYCFVILGILAVPLLRGDMRLFLGVSAAIYLVSQFSRSTGMFGLSGDFVVFDVAAWQFLFCLSAAAGRKFPEMSAFVTGMSDWQVRISIVICAILFVIINLFDPFWEFWPGLEGPYTPRFQLHPSYLIVILAVSFSVLLTMARPVRELRPFGWLLNWYFNLRLLRVIGKYSIQMFTLHVYLMFFYVSIQDRLADWQKLPVGLVLMAGYIAAPHVYEALQRRSASRQPGKIASSTGA